MTSAQHVSYCFIEINSSSRGIVFTRHQFCGRPILDARKPASMTPSTTPHLCTFLLIVSSAYLRLLSPPSSQSRINFFTVALSALSPTTFRHHNSPSPHCCLLPTPSHFPSLFWFFQSPSKQARFTHRSFPFVCRSKLVTILQIT